MSTHDASGREFDVAVVGGGLVGLATARELIRRNPSCRLGVIEKESAIARHQSGHNSGVIHSGIYYAPGSLKARLCVEGAAMLTVYCDEHQIPYRRLGKLIVARSEEELPRLDELFRRGVANGVPDVARIDAAEISKIEPNVSGLRAIYSPQTGIVDYRAVAHALAQDVTNWGGSVLTAFDVQRLERRGGRWVLRGPGGQVSAAKLITCAGLHSDLLARMTGGSPDPAIVPFRGDYWRLSPGRQTLVRGLVYPVPDPAFPFLGVHFTPRIDGEVWIGPNAVLAFAREGYRLRNVRPGELGGMMAWPGVYRMGRRYWRMGLGEMYRSLSRRALHAELRTFVPALRREDILACSSGVRAQAVTRDGALIDDFVFSRAEAALHVRNAPSPAATACLAIAQKIADQFVAV